MKWKRYPSYKDSGVEWLGEVPKHWSLGRLKQTIDSIRNGVWGEEPEGNSDYWCVRVADFDRIGLSVSQEQQTMRSAPEHQLHSRLINPYDLLIEKSGGGNLQPVGTVVWFPFFARAACSNFIARIVIKSDFDPRFLVYCHHHLYNARVNTRSIKQTTGIQNLDTESYFNELATYPPKKEQEEIASFLDHQTSRIDTLIATKQRQVELLEEKRNALITHAVTVGLDPHVKMKDSGVEWLGEVPEHWDLASVWILFSLGRGRVISALEISENPGRYPVYSSQTENEGIFGYLDTYDFEGDYLTWTTDGANAGTVFHRTGRFNCTNVCGTMKAKNIRVCYRYYFYILNIITKGYVRQDINPKLMNDVMASIKVPYMDPYEQQRIVNFLDRETSRIDSLKDKIQQSIETLQEYRSALITAAVTGQIDVREEVYPCRDNTQRLRLR
jgi:type I restriction enzyme S subunit